jgi:hypothetical protein
LTRRLHPLKCEAEGYQEWESRNDDADCPEHHIPEFRQRDGAESAHIPIAQANKSYTIVMLKWSKTLMAFNCGKKLMACLMGLNKIQQEYKMFIVISLLAQRLVRAKVAY